MGWWTDQVVPRLTDASLANADVDALRVRACAPLSGRVLEVGFGSGLNLPHLPAAVASVDAVEPSDLGWARSAARRSASALPVARIGLDGQALTAPDSAYDAALVTFSLCTIPDPALALAEVRRVLRPGAVLAFLEHGRSPDERLARRQRRLDPVQRRVCGGCHLSRDVPGLVEAAGFALGPVERGHLLAGPTVLRPWTYGFLGSARR
jgi:SAM-dependent methyltransferase